MTAKRANITLLAVLLLILFSSLGKLAIGANNSLGRSYHVSGTTLPTSLTSPSVLEGGTTNTDVNVSMLNLSNGDTGIHYITVSDCGSPAYIPINAYPIAAGTTWFISMGDTRFRGCFKWKVDTVSSDPTKPVQGSLTGVR